MITVGSSNGRKGLGFCVGREMEVIELEEGEAGAAATIDPDISLSYIDEKLHNVLGHFQKDFEGGVSAEDLGAKFGGYGSFLRSPGWSQPRTPANSSQPEGGNHNPLLTSAQLVGHGGGATNIVTLSAATAPSFQDSSQRDARLEITDRSADPHKRNPLKVRIKLGSDNLSTKKNAAIYSGLGLDVSPSSSVEDSPTESNHFGRAPQGGPDKSPNSILQIMTSFPVNGGLLLSPLPVDLIRLNEKVKLRECSRYGHVPDVGRESSVLLLNGFDLQNELKARGQKKSRPADNNNISWDSKNVNNKGCPIDTGGMKNKELDIDTLACEELVSNALKLPLLSNSYETDFSMEAHKDVVKDDCRKEDNLYGSIKGNSIAFKGRKASINETVASMKLKTDHKTSYKDQNSVALTGGKDHQPSCGQSKSKEIKSREALAVEIPIERSVTKNKKGPPAVNNVCESEPNLRHQKDFGKAGDRYRDFFGDILLEQEENELEIMKVPFKDRPSGKKIEKFSTTVADPKDASKYPHFSRNGAVADAAPAIAAPNENNDNWVCCDNCQKWRLLPYGKNPKALPLKWLCIMLNWLPGMNRCSFSEEDTTRAVVALNQGSHSQNQNNLQGSLDGAISGVAPTEVQFPNPNQQNLGFHAVSGEVKKKHEKNELFEPVNPEKPSQVPVPVTSSLLSVNSRSLNEVQQSPFGDELEFKPSRKSIDSDMEKHRNKKKENTVLEHYSDGGTTTNSKMKIKRANDQDSFGASKKVKKESIHHNVDEWKPECAGDIIKAGPSSSSGLTTDAAGNDQSNYIHRSPSKDFKGDEKDHKLSIKKLRDHDVLIPFNDSTLDSKGCDIDTATKKRKIKECKDYQEYSGALMSIPNGEGNDSIISKGNCNAGHRVGATKIQPVEKDLSQPCNNAMDCLKRDLGTSQHVVATSSSSLVSGSNKSKTILQEVKSSPVESVSSSPLRVSNIDNHTSGRMNLAEIDPRDAYIVKNTSSPRRCSDGEDNHERQLGSVRKEKCSTITRHGSHKSAVLTFQNKDAGPLSSKTKKQVVDFNEVSNDNYLNGSNDTIDHYGDKSQASDLCLDEGGKSNNHYHASQSRSRKSGMGSSSKSKDKNRSTKSEYSKHKGNDMSNASHNHALSHQAKRKHGKNKAEKRNAHNRDSRGKYSDVELERSLDALQTVKQNLLRDHDSDKSSSVFHSDKIDQKEKVSSRGRSLPLPLSGQGQKGNGPSRACVAFEGDDALKGKDQTRKAESENGRHLEASSPLRKDSSSQAATTAMKEAKDLKHLADRLKNAGSNAESTGFYFQAVLKFLHGAFLIESCNSENSKYGEQSMPIYSSTGKLCEFCAHEYERSKDMAGAALAYKCMEVAYMRVIYSSNTTANKDRHELQSVLQMIHPGESLSSACDVDATTRDKVSIAKGVNSPQVVVNHVTSARNRSSLVRLLNFAQDVNLAMEASRKSWIAFGAANVRPDGPQHKEVISSIKKALDFSFQDVEGFLRLVRLAMEAISR